MDGFGRRFRQLVATSDGKDVHGEMLAFLALANDLLAARFWEQATSGWNMAEACYKRLNIAMSRMEPGDSATSTASPYAIRFTEYSALMARTTRLWQIDSRQPMLKPLMLGWMQNVAQCPDVRWLAIRKVWTEFQEILHVLLDIGNAPIQLDLLEILSLYFYELSAADVRQLVAGSFAGCEWLTDRLIASDQCTVDLTYRQILAQLNRQQRPPKVVSCSVPAAHFNKLSVPIRAPQQLGLLIDFNLGVLSLSLCCCVRTFSGAAAAAKKRKPDAEAEKDVEKWMSCEFSRDNIQSARVYKSAHRSNYDLYVKLTQPLRLHHNFRCKSLVIALSARNLAELQAARVFERFGIERVDQDCVSLAAQSCRGSAIDSEAVAAHNEENYRRSRKSSMNNIAKEQPDEPPAFENREICIRVPPQNKENRSQSGTSMAAKDQRAGSQRTAAALQDLWPQTRAAHRNTIDCSQPVPNNKHSAAAKEQRAMSNQNAMPDLKQRPKIIRTVASDVMPNYPTASTSRQNTDIFRRVAPDKENRLETGNAIGPKDQQRYAAALRNCTASKENSAAMSKRSTLPGTEQRTGKLPPLANVQWPLPVAVPEIIAADSNVAAAEIQMHSGDIISDHQNKSQRSAAALSNCPANNRAATDTANGAKGQSKPMALSQTEKLPAKLPPTAAKCAEDPQPLPDTLPEIPPMVSSSVAPLPAIDPQSALITSMRQASPVPAPVDPYDLDACFPTWTPLPSARRKQQRKPIAQTAAVDPFSRFMQRNQLEQKQQQQQQQQQPNTSVQTARVLIADNNLVSFSYRRRRSNENGGATTKEVSIQFCDNSADEREARPGATAAKVVGVGQRRGRGRPPSNKTNSTNNQARRKTGVRRKSGRRLTAPPADDSSCDEILPVSKRSAAKRQAQSLAQHNRTNCAAQDMQLSAANDICRAEPLPSPADYTLPSAEQHPSAAQRSPLVDTPPPSDCPALADDRQLSYELTVPPPPPDFEDALLPMDSALPLPDSLPPSAEPYGYSRIIRARSDCSSSTSVYHSSPPHRALLKQTLREPVPAVTEPFSRSADRALTTTKTAIKRKQPPATDGPQSPSIIESSVVEPMLAPQTDANCSPHTAENKPDEEAVDQVYSSHSSSLDVDAEMAEVEETANAADGVRIENVTDNKSDATSSGCSAETLAPVAPAAKRRRLFAANEPTKELAVVATTSPSDRRTTLPVINATVGQQTHQFTSRIQAMLQQSAVDFEHRVHDSMDDFQRSLNALLDTNQQSVQQLKSKLNSINGRIERMAVDLGAERDRYQQCLADIDLTRTRFIEDICGLNDRWKRIKARCNEVSRSAGLSEAEIRDQAAQFGESVWRTAVQQTSHNIRQFLSNLNGGGGSAQ